MKTPSVENLTRLTSSSRWSIRPAREFMTRSFTSSPPSFMSTYPGTLVEMYLRWSQSMVCHVVGPLGEGTARVGIESPVRLAIIEEAHYERQSSHVKNLEYLVRRRSETSFSGENWGPSIQARGAVNTLLLKRSGPGML